MATLLARSALSNVLGRTSVDEKLATEVGVPHMSDSIANLALLAYLVDVLTNGITTTGHYRSISAYQ